MADANDLKRTHPDAARGDDQKKSDKELDKELDKEVKDSFPASDPPSSTQPGSGITGAEVKREGKR